MTDLDFRLRDTGRSYVVEALTDRARAHEARWPAELRRPIEITHDGWLPLALSLQREGFTVKMTIQ